MAVTELRSVIIWFESAEQMLMAILDVIPYEAVHENVWSPRLVTVLLETCSQLDSLLKQSMREHLLSGVPLGIWLSGGLDSSTLLHYAAAASSSRLKTFSISFVRRRILGRR